MKARFINHILHPVLPETVPDQFAPRGHFSPKDQLVSIRPGVEDRYLLAPGDTVEIAIVVHAVIDRDYQGQFAYLQIARRPHDQVPFGDWHYGFYYRGGDVGWDQWQLDLIFGTEWPTYTEFGRYVDAHG